MDPVAQLLLSISCLLVLGAFGEFIFAKTRIPDIVWLVIAGILAGPVFRLVSPDLLKQGIPFFGAIALTVILSSGAFNLQLQDVASASPRGILLGLAGFVVSVAAVWIFLFISWHVGFIHVRSPLGWLIAGAIVGGTSSVVIMPSMALCRVPSRVARMLEVESAATDALSVILVMVLIDLELNGAADLSRPLIALGRELGIGFAGGLIAAALIMPGVALLRDKAHGYTVFLAAMLALYAVVGLFGGNGAIAVLIASLLVGNASLVVPRLIPGADASRFTQSSTTGIMQAQMTFLVKSFFFFLIGVMFPMDLRLVAVAALGVIFLFAWRILTARCTTVGMNLTRKEFWFTSAAIPRGLAAGVLATLPSQYGVAGTEQLAAGVFAAIVVSNLVFAAAFWYVSRLPDADATPGTPTG